MKYTILAIESLLEGQGFSLQQPEPTTQAEFEDKFSIQVNTVNGDAIMSNNPSDFPITWSQVVEKRTEVEVEKNLNDVRNIRNKKLLDTDYWLMDDTPEPTQAQLDYRQALRDITDTYSSLEDVVWPTKPE